MKLRLIRLLLALLALTIWHFARTGNEPTATNQPSSSPAAQAAANKTPAKPYPFGTSVVSGEKFADNGSVVKLVRDGYQVKLANQGEVAAFNKNPAVYMAKIVEAYKTPKPCPLTVCPVMGDKLDADAYSFVYEGREFKFCCDSCMDDFEKDPAKFMKIWDDAEKAAQPVKQ